MTEIVGAEKPSLEDLAHHGVKGMKWGQHKKSGSLDNAVRSATIAGHLSDSNRPSGSDIKDARARVHLKNREIKTQKKAVKQAGKRGEDTSKGEQQIAKMKADLLKNPDRITASRMTHGEAALAVILLTPGGAAGHVAGRAIATHLIKREVEKAGGNSSGH